MEWLGTISLRRWHSPELGRMGKYWRNRDIQKVMINVFGGKYEGSCAPATTPCFIYIIRTRLWFDKDHLILWFLGKWNSMLIRITNGYGQIPKGRMDPLSFRVSLIVDYLWWTEMALNDEWTWKDMKVPSDSLWNKRETWSIILVQCHHLNSHSSQFCTQTWLSLETSGAPAHWAL